MNPRHTATQLFEQVEALAAGLGGGEATLIWQSVAVVCDEPEQFLLARLLACFGAEVTVFTPRIPIWNEVDHPAILAELRRLLNDRAPHLRLSELDAYGEKNFKEAAGFTLVACAPEALAEQTNQTFNRLIGIDVVPDDSSSSVDMVNKLSRIVEFGSDIDIIAMHTVLSETTRNAIEHAGGALGIGVRTTQPAPGEHFQQWLGLVRLAGPLGEFPGQYADDIHGHEVMTHARTRLEFAAQFVKDAVVLEAGCGAGLGARLFRRRGAVSVTGIDNSEDALAIARDTTDDEHISYQQWDLNRTPFPFEDQSFDCVICIEVLEHITAHEAAIGEFDRLLRPGGVLVVSVPEQLFETSWARINRYRNVFHLRTPGEAELLSMLQRFAQVRIARQLSCTGAMFVFDDDNRPHGAFVTHSQGLAKSPAEVIAAVCTKSPVHDRALSFSPTLHIFRNDLGRQIELRNQHQALQSQNTRDRQVLWRELNRLQNRRQAEPNEITAWRKQSGVVFTTESIHSAADFAPLHTTVSEDASTDVLPDAQCWAMSTNQPNVLTPTATPRRAATAIFPLSEPRVRFATMLRWRQRGAKTFWFDTPRGWKATNATRAIIRRFSRGVRARLTRLFGIDQDSKDNESQQCFADPQLWRERINQDAHDAAQSVDIPGSRPLRIIQHIGSLSAGGAERQLCNLCIELTARGFDTSVLTTHPLRDSGGHFAADLRHAGVPARQASPISQTEAAERIEAARTNSEIDREQLQALLDATPEEIRDDVSALTAELIAHTPDILHCWLDHPNITGALAGLIAGVPRILLSTRNSNPSNFPRLHSPYLREWYRVVTASPRVRLLANSRSGAASYAEWIGIPRDHLHVVLNGIRLDQFPKPSDETRRAAREHFQIADTDHVVCGIFRLDSEKQPELFLQVINHLRPTLQARSTRKLRVLLVGVGPLQEEIQQLIDELDMNDTVTMLGRRSDIETVLLASDAMLLTSTLEGCPNVVLEAQHLRTPLVATAGGGTVDVIVNDETGYLCGHDEPERMADRLAAILLDDALQMALGEAGRALTGELFTIDRMVDETTRVYDHMLNKAAGDPPVMTSRQTTSPCKAGVDSLTESATRP